MKLRDARQIDVVLAEDKMSEFAGAIYALNSRVSALKKGESSGWSYYFGSIYLSFGNIYRYSSGDPGSGSNEHVVEIRRGFFRLYRRSALSSMFGNSTMHYLNVGRVLKCLSEFDGIAKRMKVCDAERESRKKLSLREKQDRQNSSDDSVRAFVRQYRRG